MGKSSKKRKEPLKYRVADFFKKVDYSVYFFAFPAVANGVTVLPALALGFTVPSAITVATNILVFLCLIIGSVLLRRKSRHRSTKIAKRVLADIFSENPKLKLKKATNVKFSSLIEDNSATPSTYTYEFYRYKSILVVALKDAENNKLHLHQKWKYIGLPAYGRNMWIFRNIMVDCHQGNPGNNKPIIALAGTVYECGKVLPVSIHALYYKSARTNRYYFGDAVGAADAAATKALSSQIVSPADIHTIYFHTSETKSIFPDFEESNVPLSYVKAMHGLPEKYFYEYDASSHTLAKDDQLIKVKK